MQERHTDREIYFEEQAYTTRTYVMPFISDRVPVRPGLKVLEVGCGEGGNLLPFLETGWRATGVDLSEKKILNARKFLADFDNPEQLLLVAADIYQTGPELDGPFDLIMMRDVIEHIHDQERFMRFIRSQLKEDGIFFLAFPPWYNPFGGHQQICASRFLSKLPYFHLLPAPLYSGILTIFGEPKERIANLLEVKLTGISIERFRRIAGRSGYSIDKEILYAVNPNYEVKFGLKPRKLPGLLSWPFLRNFITTSVYILLKRT